MPPTRIPCFIYIDECDEFVEHDQNAANILLNCAACEWL